MCPTAFTQHPTSPNVNQDRLVEQAENVMFSACFRSACCS